MKQKIRIQNILLEKENPQGTALFVDFDIYLDGTASITQSKSAGPHSKPGVTYNNEAQTTSVLNCSKDVARKSYRALTGLGYTLAENIKVSAVTIDSGSDVGEDGEECLRTYIGLGGDVIRDGKSVDFDDDFGLITSYGGGLNKGIYTVAENWAARIEKALGSPVEILNDGITH